VKTKNNASWRAVGVWLYLASAAVVAMPTGVLALAETGAPVLDYPLGVRSEGMAQTGTADASDPANLYFNAANVTAVEGVYGAGSYMLLAPWFSNDIWFGHGSLGGGYAFGTNRPIRVAADVTMARLSYGTVTTTDPMGQPLTEGKAREQYIALTVGASTRFGERSHVALGLGVKRWTAHFPPAQFTTGESNLDFSANMVDVGAVVSTVMDAGDWRVQPSVGLACVNLGSDIEVSPEQKDPLPSKFNYGVTMRVAGPEAALGSATVPTVSAVLNIEGIHGLNEQRPTWGFGSEVAFMDAVFLRWGRRVDDHDRAAFSAWGIALGVPLGHFRARLDYANRWSSALWGGTVALDKFGATVVWLFDQD
jgi:hypothetical protein